MFGFLVLMGLMGLTAGFSSFSGSRGSDGTTLDGFTDIRLESAPIIAGCRQGRQRAGPPDQPKRGRVNAGAHARIPALESDQRGYGYPETLGPGSLGLTAADSGDGQVFAQRAQSLRGGGRQYLQGLRALWHN